MARPTRIVPAILTDDPKILETMLRQAETFTDYVQFDIMDGEFVPSHSIDCEHLAAVPTKLGWEAHLMVQHPEEHLDCLQKARAQKVVLHFEATASPEEVIAQARRLSLGVGLAVNPATPASAILRFADKVDSILFLTVNPGFYGSQFIPEVLEKITDFRKSRPDADIGVDGGIKESNVAQIAQLGVNSIYVGSAIFLQTDPAASFRRLTELAQEAPHE
jgi:ribulose-phosphate 3-epimerase